MPPGRPRKLGSRCAQVSADNPHAFDPEIRSDFLSNSRIAELLATAAEDAKQPLQKALRRAARKSILWPEEAVKLVAEGRSLEEFPGVGPYMEKLIRHWIEDPPELPDSPKIRSGFFTLPQARAVLATNPDWFTNIRGDLQMHTQWSDGSGSIQEMAEAAGFRGYEYIGITDHSKGLKIAGGINEIQLRQQADEISTINDALESSGQAIRVLRSIELNLSPEGLGDMDDEALSRLDLVLGCFHSALRRKEDQTDRFLAALRNPSIHILGHPRGRIYNYRVGLTADWSRIFDVAAELNKAVEIDSYPDRQDLSIDLIRLARKAGCQISLGTDSHGPSQLALMEFGAAAALSAGIKRDRILNFMSREALLDWAANRR